MKDFLKSCFKKNTALVCAFSLFFCFVFSGCASKNAEKTENESQTQTSAYASDGGMKNAAASNTYATDTSEAVTEVSQKTEAEKKTDVSQKNEKKTAVSQEEEQLEDFNFDKIFDDAAELQNYLDSEAEKEDNRLIKWYVDPEGNITTEGDKGILGFGYSTSEHCFYATGNAWQRNFGYTELYDKVSELIVISYDTIRVYFTYDNKDWMIQLWKGQYGFVLEGGEVGVYNRPHSFNVTTYYNCAKDEDRLPISLTLYDRGRKKFSRKAQTSWWMTGFVPGQLGLGVGVGTLLTQLLTETTTITFKDEKMRDAFVEGLKDVKTIFNNVDYAAAVSNNILIMPGERLYSFKEGDGTSASIFNGTYKIDGNSVTITWR